MKNKTKRRATRTTAEQYSMMLDFFDSNKGLAEGKFASMHGKQDAYRKWDELAELLNGIGGAKIGPQRQATWRDLKSHTSIKARERRKEMAKTGGRPLTLPALTELDLRVLHILGHEYSEGSSICPESFPEEEETKNWPTEQLDESAEIPAAHVNSRPVRSTPFKNKERRRVPKRTQADSAREQFASIAKLHADTIMMQAESAKQQAAASQQLAEAAVLQANACDRMASAMEKLAIAMERL